MEHITEIIKDKLQEMRMRRQVKEQVKSMLKRYGQQRRQNKK